MSPQELREMVVVMRELGVLECEGIKLAPIRDTTPAPAFDAVAARKAQETADEELLFAASRGFHDEGEDGTA